MKMDRSKKCTFEFFKAPQLNFIIIFLLMFFVSCEVWSQKKATILGGKWFLEMEHKDIGFTQIIMEFKAKENGQFEAHTRKGAVKDILGGWNSMLARTFSKSFKYGSLLRIEDGIYSVVNDTLKFTGILTSVVGKYKIEGFSVGDQISAKLSNKNGYKGSIKGSRQIPMLPIRDYNSLFNETMSLTQNKIFNKNILTTKEWKDFHRTMNKVSAKMQDDLDMIFAFYYYSSKLPISHYMLLKPIIQEKNQHSADKIQRVFLEEKTPDTAYLKITSFEGSAREMDSIFEVLANHNYKNLIVDLRNNSGGSVDAGMSFATHVTDTTFYGGVFLTQKYFNNHKTLPTVSEYDTFPHFTESNYDLLMEGIHNTEGICLKVIPQEPVYKGKLFILTNGFTASTCEPIVYGFKQLTRATVVGSSTAGAMLAAEMFDLSGGFKIFLPTADYYASDGYRIDKKGVEPNIKVEGDALEYTLKLIE